MTLGLLLVTRYVVKHEMDFVWENTKKSEVARLTVWLDYP